MRDRDPLICAIRDSDVFRFLHCSSSLSASRIDKSLGMTQMQEPTLFATMAIRLRENQSFEFQLFRSEIE